MKVAELIERLREMPPAADVWVLWDGAVRSEVEVVYQARGNRVVLKEGDEPVYHREDGLVRA